MKNRAIAELAILFGVMYLPGYFAQAGNIGGPTFDSLYYHLQYAVLAIPQIGLVLYFMSGRGPLWKVRYGLLHFSAFDFVRGLVILGALLLTAIPVQILLTQVLQLPDNPAWQLDEPLLLLPTAVTLTFGAIREEAFFRSFLLTEVEDIGAKTSHAIIGSAVLFGMGHAYQGLGGLLMTVVMGAVLGAIYARRRNIYEVIIGHTLYNFAVVVYGAMFAG